MAYPGVHKSKFCYLPDETTPAPGPRHASIAEAFDASEAEGTCSILDIERITDTPDFASACPLPSDELIALFGTAEPTRKQLEAVLLSRESDNDGFWEQIDRGHGRYVVVYDNGVPREIFFCWIFLGLTPKGVRCAYPLPPLQPVRPGRPSVRRRRRRHRPDSPNSVMGDIGVRYAW